MAKRKRSEVKRQVDKARSTAEWVALGYSNGAVTVVTQVVLSRLRAEHSLSSLGVQVCLCRPVSRARLCPLSLYLGVLAQFCSAAVVGDVSPQVDSQSPGVTETVQEIQVLLQAFFSRGQQNYIISERVTAAFPSTVVRSVSSRSHGVISLSAARTRLAAGTTRSSSRTARFKNTANGRKRREADSPAQNTHVSAVGECLPITRLKLGKLKVVRRQLLQRYEHQPFVSCLAGLYGCQWRRYQRARAQPGECCCSKVECGSFGLLILTFFLSFVFLYFWSEAQNDYNDFDWFNFGTLGFWFPWSLVILVVAAALFTYIALLLVLAVCLLSEGQRLYLHWSHKIGIVVTLVFSVAATAVLSDLWSKEWKTLLLSLQVTAPFLHVAAVLLMTLLSWPIALHFFRMNKRVLQVVVLGLYLSVLFSLYLVPLGMYSPCIKEAGTLGPAPALIGHRGAPMLAPENTVMSFEKAVEAGGEGLETDVTISYDGVPFLMHDSTLMRTTNVAEVFPNRTHTDASMFTWAELQQLNAGDWFLLRDPFGMVSSLSEADRSQALNQSVPSLAQFLEVAAHSGRLVLFDLRRPPYGHPYSQSYISTTLQVVQTHINSSQVLWLPSEDRELVQALDPELQQTSGEKASIQELTDNHITKLNLHYSTMSQQQIRKYWSVNISTNLYVISQPWLYSLAWCAGAQSVTTNSVHVLSGLSKPLFLMTPEEYSLMWILTDAVSALLIIGIFVFHWWRERGLPFWSGSRQTHENGPYSKFRTELSDVWSISSVSVRPDLRSTPSSPCTPHLPTITEE
ncbi:glycerophosphodiester phosphodiesterase domain-containing protein 5-like [Myripristis murdjan]|uniref:glycerophosphodiester phosphodiesterase domain-containing protein 5-like n=1 Tax=Myripristis murdjan TaxID=586833 RepID=UPI0011763DBF|nr:glycerophosphodiester phosphodiesterase domain-containing protein 5-like [Myripristis murdjan]